MPTLLVIHHTASPTLDAMLESVLEGTGSEGIVGVDVVTRAALAAGPADVLAADGLVLGTPANIGYMSGALKVFFDSCYYPCLRETPGLPFGLYVHGNNDVTGAVRSVEVVASGLRWKRAAPVVEVVGELTGSGRAALHELGALMAATVMGA